MPFWMLWLGVMFQGLAAFMPGTYLPGQSSYLPPLVCSDMVAYASALNLPNNVGTLSVALMNLARVPGQVVIGYASDKLGARTLILFMAFASGVSVMTGWGLAHDTGGVIGFAIAFGGFAGSYTALFPRSVTSAPVTAPADAADSSPPFRVCQEQSIQLMIGDDPHLRPMLYALFSFARGVGSIASGPLSTALLNGSSRIHLGAAGWGGLILWTGAGMLSSGIGAGYKGLKVD